MTSRLVFVDDEPSIRNVFSCSLSDMGYEVWTAADAAQALRLIEQTGPDIVITDIKMPGMDGLELTRQIKAVAPEIEVIILTGHGDMETAVHSLRAEVADFITKPVSDEALELALKRADEKIELRRQIREYTRNLEQLVEERTRELLQAERLAAVGQAALSVSHSIKNISGGLEGSLYLLKRGMERDNREYLRQGLDMLVSNVTRIKELSMDLLSLGKPEVIRPRWDDPNRPPREVVELFAPRAEESKVALEADLDPKLDRLFFDPEALHRCLVNLVTNAFEALEEADDPGKERLVALRTRRQDSGGVAFEVEDTGSGLDPTIQKQLGSSFTSTKGGHGTGLGLVLTRKLVQEHGGTLQWSSKPGQGCVFQISLPESGAGKAGEEEVD